MRVCSVCFGARRSYGRGTGEVREGEVVYGEC